MRRFWLFIAKRQNTGNYLSKLHDSDRHKEVKSEKKILKKVNNKVLNKIKKFNT